MANNVKQRCVMVPTLFSVHLSAKLEVGVVGVPESANILKTERSEKIVCEMLFADDKILVAHDAVGM